MHVEVNGTRLWFDVAGPLLVPDGETMRTRPTVVLLHGGPFTYDHSYFKPHFDWLAQQAQVVYLDLRGHGRSATVDLVDWSLEQCADDVAAACARLGVERPVVVGHSMGAPVALLCAVRHPELVGGVVVVGGFARWDHERLVEGFRAVAGDEVAALAARSYESGGVVTDDEWARVFAAFGPVVPDSSELARRVGRPELGPEGMDVLRALDILDEIATVTAPTLVVVGALDAVTPVPASQEVAAALQATRSRLEVLAGAGHFPWLDQPERLRAVLTAFVADVA